MCAFNRIRAASLLPQKVVPAVCGWARILTLLTAAGFSVLLSHGQATDHTSSRCTPVFPLGEVIC